MVLVAPSKKMLQMNIDAAANFLLSRYLKVNLGKTRVLIAPGEFRKKGTIEKN